MDQTQSEIDFGDDEVPLSIVPSAMQISNLQSHPSSRKNNNGTDMESLNAGGGASGRDAMDGDTDEHEVTINANCVTQCRILLTDVENSLGWLPRRWSLSYGALFPL